ncbi:MAG: SulP family inorganic anion transporter [Methanobacterium sp.]|nr:SulP family inorganic anion transporter [Methanobacterium sp.]
MKSFSSYLPITKWARNYNKDWLRPDIIAGITVGAFLIPESIAYVSLANLPPEIGLYSAMVAVFIYVIFGTSRQLSVGPLSTLSILVGSTLGSLMIPNAAQYAMIASLVAVIAGLLAILSWALRLGFIVKFISKPVLTGFLAGIALFIASGQIAKLFGISGGSGTFFQRKVVGYIPQGLPSLVIPDPSLLDVNILITLAATVFLISYMEGYLFAAEYAAKNKYKIDKNQELLALGASNIAVGLFQGLPVAGALSRTAINNESGAKTQLAGGVSGLVILLVLLFLTGIFTNLPETILAAIVLFIIKGLVDIPHLRNIYNFSKIEFIIAIITLLSVLFFGALEGIVIGVILSVVGLIKKMYNPHIAVLGKMPGKDQFLDIKRRPEAEIIPEILIVRVDGSQIFLNTEDIKNNILNLIDHEYKDTKLFILDFEATSFIDHSGTEMLEGLYDELQQRGIKLKAANMYGPLKDSLQKTKLEEEIVESTVSLTIEDCIEVWEMETRN